MSKVLFFASDYKIGLSSLLSSQACAFAQSGIDLHVICGEGEQEAGLREKVESTGISCTVVPGLDEHNDYWRKVHAIRELIFKTQSSIVHVQNNWQLALVTGAKRFTGRGAKVIYTLHGFRHNNPIKSKIAKVIIGGALFLFADKVICMSQYLKDEFSLLKNKIELLPLGIDDAFFEACPLPTTNGLRIIFPAQFREGKNQDMIIRAFTRYLLQSGNKESFLCLPGSGPKLDEMKTLVAELGMSERVSFPGQCTKQQIIELYKQSNVAVIASNSETFGQSIVEPFAMGRIVITRPVGIAPDIIRHGENGFFFYDENQLTECMAEAARRLLCFDFIPDIKTATVFRWRRVAVNYNVTINELL